MIHLVTFATDDMSISAELCANSAQEHGVSLVHTFSHGEFKKSSFYRDYESLFSQPRGIGFWAWKPFVIARVLYGETDPFLTLKDGDILIYSDAGIEFINNVNHIIDRMDQDIFLFGNMWEHAHWCKRDIIEAIWPLDVEREFDKAGKPHLMDWNEPTWGRFGKQAQASVIFFRVSDYTRKFVREWLDWCLFEGGRLIDDSPSRTPNHPEFRENRHDQAILTTMAYREGIKLHWWPAMYNDGAFVYERGDYPDEGYPVLFHHHRRRNHEWSAAA